MISRKERAVRRRISEAVREIARRINYLAAIIEFQPTRIQRVTHKDMSVLREFLKDPWYLERALHTQCKECGHHFNAGDDPAGILANYVVCPKCTFVIHPLKLFACVGRSWWVLGMEYADENKRAGR